MREPRILVVGAGPAGLSAAIALAEAGRRVLVADHAPGIGGAVYAGPRSDPMRPGETYPEATALFRALQARRDRIEIRCATAFAGLDARGNALLTGDRGLLFRPQALILATGARELVRPRPGWTRPGVTTVGALQTTLKTTGQTPPGRTVLAGSGALLYATGAQLARAGHPPAAILEAGRPFARPGAALRLPAAVLKEAAGYMLTLRLARVPILGGTELEAIASDGAALRLTTSRRGRRQTIAADRLALHDGLARNDYGFSVEAPIPVVRAGDCREVLGRWAAAKDGIRAARQVLRALGDAGADRPPPSLARDAAAQRRLSEIFAHDSAGALARLPDDTILCRCENRTLGALKAQGAERASPRTLRLQGRFGMGPCQGRFCLDWVARLAQPPVDPEALRGTRWPIRPVAVADILAAEDHLTDTHDSHQERSR